MLDPTLATPKRLASPTPVQIDEMVELLMDAFKGIFLPLFSLDHPTDDHTWYLDDPLTPIFFDSDLELARLQMRASIGSAVVGGLVHVLTIPTLPDASEEGEGGDLERIVGVALWYPPGSGPNATPEQRKAGSDALTARAKEKNPGLQAWWVDYVSRLSLSLSSSSTMS